MSTVSAIVYTYDVFREDAIGVSAPDANAPAYAERTFLNYDAIEGVNHRDYKVIMRIDPIGSVSGPTPVEISVGAVDAPGETFTFGPALDFDGTPETRQLDYTSAGRYHAIRIDYTGLHPIRINGFDVDVKIEGTRG